MKTNTLLVTITILTTFLNSHAFTLLSGDICGKTLDKLNSLYLVKEDIFIPGGETVIIKEGVALLFNSFTGLSVFGSLHVEESFEEPVTFTSINDVNHNDSSETFSYIPKEFLS
jgi:hypothetical protein